MENSIGSAVIKILSYRQKNLTTLYNGMHTWATSNIHNSLMYEEGHEGGGETILPSTVAQPAIVTLTPRVHFSLLQLDTLIDFCVLGAKVF